VNCWVDGGCQFEHYRRCVWGVSYDAKLDLTMLTMTMNVSMRQDRVLLLRWVRVFIGRRFMFTYPE